MLYLERLERQHDPFLDMRTAPASSILKEKVVVSYKYKETPSLPPSAMWRRPLGTTTASSHSSMAAATGIDFYSGK